MLVANSKSTPKCTIYLSWFSLPQCGCFNHLDNHWVQSKTRWITDTFFFYLYDRHSLRLFNKKNIQFGPYALTKYISGAKQKKNFGISFVHNCLCLLIVSWILCWTCWALFVSPNEFHMFGESEFWNDGNDSIKYLWKIIFPVPAVTLSENVPPIEFLYRQHACWAIVYISPKILRAIIKATNHLFLMKLWNNFLCLPLLLESRGIIFFSVFKWEINIMIFPRWLFEPLL